MQQAIADGESFSLLLIEDNPGDARLLELALRTSPGDRFAVTLYDRLSAIDWTAANQQHDLLLLDLSLPDSRGLDSVRTARRLAPGLPLVVLTGSDDEQLALDAIHAGADDYLVKGRTDAALLRRSLRYAMERHRARGERERLAARLAAALAKLERLGGLLPICSRCKRVRDDKGYWSQIESYIKELTDADCTHGLCPGCAERTLREYHAGAEDDAAGG